MKSVIFWSSVLLFIATGCCATPHRPLPAAWSSPQPTEQVMGEEFKERWFPNGAAVSE